MMDMAGILDPLLTLGSVVAVLMTAVGSMSLESTTVSTSPPVQSDRDASRITFAQAA